MKSTFGASNDDGDNVGFSDFTGGFMRTVRIWGLLGFMVVALAAHAQQGQRRDGDLKEGVAAPDFTIKDVEGKKSISLSALNGKPVVLIFGSCT
jgi:cytochrome oxidase Cu insertion factor (SCO1/SenC/PrrC family)